jgi:hypothetical protein
MPGTLAISGSSSLSWWPKTAGEMATYSFTFTSTADFESDDYVKIVFPMDFDPFFGGSNDGGM